MSMQNTIAERIRELAPVQAEAIEEGLYPLHSIAAQLRERAFDFGDPTSFDDLMQAADALEGLA